MAESSPEIASDWRDHGRSRGGALGPDDASGPSAQRTELVSEDEEQTIPKKKAARITTVRAQEHLRAETLELAQHPRPVAACPWAHR